MAKKAYVGVKALPDGYTEVEYIEGTGTQYIDSGFIPNGKTRIVMDVEIVSHLDHGAYFGTRAATSGTDSVSNTLFIMSGGTLRSDFYGKTGSSTGIPEGRHILDRNMNVTTAGDYTITLAASTTASTYPLAIFGVNTAGEVSKCACIKLYSCSIYDDGVLARKFIPCLNGDGVAGMYDCVGDTFYGNGGSGEFLFGSRADYTAISRTLKNIYVGAEKEFPVYDANLTDVTITTSNISTYFTVANGSYYFAGSGSTFTSNNKGVASTTATTTLTALRDYSSLSFTYSYSGESGCDYLNLKVNGVAIETNSAGSTTTKTYTGSILAGQTIEFSFRKDGSVDSYDDCATWSNMVVSSKVQIGTELKSVARKIKKAYVGVGGVARPVFSSQNFIYYGKATDLTAVRQYFGGASFMDNRYAIFLGGHYSSSFYSNCEAYDSNLTRYVVSNSYLTGCGTAGSFTGEYVVFAGAAYDNYNTTSTAVSINKNLVCSNISSLNGSLYDCGAISIGDYAVFFGGQYWSGSSSSSNSYERAYVNAYNKNLTRSNPDSLSYAAKKPSVGRTKHYAIVRHSVYAYAYSETLVKTTLSNQSTSISESEGGSAGDNAVFFGPNSSNVEAINDNLVFSTIGSVSLARRRFASVNCNNCAVFGGGGVNVDIITDELVISRLPDLSISRSYNAGARVNDYVLFAGGGSSASVDVYLIEN